MRAEGAPESIVIEEVEIKLATRRVVVQGRESRLTPKEFDLLQYLLAESERGHSAHPIAAGRCGGRDYGDQVEYLRVFVNQLRKRSSPTRAS